MIEKYPEGTTASIEDFRRSSWKNAIGSSKLKGYHSLWQFLSGAALAAIQEGDPAQGKVLWLMADACSMNLKPASANEPFKPIMANELRTVLSEDFSEQDIDLLAQVSEELTNPWLQARLADLAWLLKLPRSLKHALLAIDAYRMIPLDIETWLKEGRECWERAIRLSRTLQAGAGERISEIESAVLLAFDAAKEENGFFALWLSDLLLSNNLGGSRKTDIAERLQCLAQIFDGQSKAHHSRSFFAASAKWFDRAKDKRRAAEMTVRVAEAWVNEATNQSSHMVAADFYEHAIQVYRTIPRSERALHKVEERLLEIHAALSEAGKESLNEMETLTLPTFDITEIVESARTAIRGKDATGAIFSLANVFSGFRVSRLREQAQQTLKDHPFSAIFPATHFSRDGRVVAKIPGLGDNNYQLAVWAEVIRSFRIELSLAAQGQIWPALSVAILEHRLKEWDFISLADRSPIVPDGRARLFGKALFAGYDQDFVGALHLIVPQFEHMVRWHLKAAGVKTTNLDKEGIENELGLSSLMDLPSTDQIFGEDIAFEIKALLCDPLGPNLRNELAHGLLGDNNCESTYSIYAWWLGLKLVVNTFWNSARVAGSAEDNDEQAEVEVEPPAQVPPKQVPPK